MDPTLLTDEDSPIKSKWLPYVKTTTATATATTASELFNRNQTTSSNIQQRLPEQTLTTPIETINVQNMSPINDVIPKTAANEDNNTTGLAGNNGISASPLPGLMAATHARHEAICAHLHHAFQTGAFSDLVVQIPAYQLAFNLHTVVVSASPLFRHLLMVSAANKTTVSAGPSTSTPINGLHTLDTNGAGIDNTPSESTSPSLFGMPSSSSASSSNMNMNMNMGINTNNGLNGGPPFEVVLRPEDPNITKEGLCLALAHLYSAGALHRLTVNNARAVLAAAWWLGLEDLCSAATAVCQADIRMETAGIYTEFVSDTNTDPDELVGLSPEIVNNDTPLPPSNRASIQPAHVVTDRYGVYSRAIRDTAYIYLCDRLLDDLRSLSDGRDILLRTLCTLRFAWFKRLMESNRFRCGTDMERYQLAKEAVQRRKQLRAGQPGGDREESVILAFGQVQGGRIAIVRKPPRSVTAGRERVLWRVPAMNGLSSEGHH